MRYALSVSLIAASLCLLAGCGGEQKPANLPKLEPCQITVTKGGQPFDDATISLYPESGQWSAGGTTNASGVATMKTQSKYDGVPAGKYKVAVNKLTKAEAPVLTENMSMEEKRKLSMDAAKQVKSLVPDQLTIAAKSPIEIEVVAGTKNYDIDLDKYASASKK